MLKEIILYILSWSYVIIILFLLTSFFTTVALIQRKVFHIKKRQEWVVSRAPRKPQRALVPVTEQENVWLTGQALSTTDVVLQPDTVVDVDNDTVDASDVQERMRRISSWKNLHDAAKEYAATPTLMRRVPSFPEFSSRNLPGVSQHLADQWNVRGLGKKSLRRPFRILSLDGGGVRGVFAAVVLERILKVFPTFLDQVDIIAGSSTGALIALLIGAGYTPTQIKNIYLTNCSYIFHATNWRIYNPFNSKYSDKWKHEGLKWYFRDMKLGDLGKNVVLTAFKLNSGGDDRMSFFPQNMWRPALLSNVPKGNGVIDADNDLPVIEAVMRATAAPTFFPAWNFYVDGGIFQNDPSMCALTKAIAHYPDVTAENVIILSIGSGMYPRSIQTKDLTGVFTGADWGIFQWAPHLVDLLIESSQLNVELNQQMLLGRRFHRVNMLLQKDMKLDDVEGMSELVELAEALDLDDCMEWIVETGFADLKQ